MTKPPNPGYGGKRPGAGRKVGVGNKVTETERKKALTGGPSPLEILTELARDHFRDYRAERRKTRKTRNEDILMAKSKAALEAADKAAPYLHPKQASIQHTGKGGGPIKYANVPLDKLSDAELDALEPVIVALAASGDLSGTDPDGEGSPPQGA